MDIETCFQASKNEVGLDHYQARKNIAWYRHITLAMVAHLAFTAAAQPPDPPPDTRTDHAAALLGLVDVADFDVSKPSTARVYDYWLGGKDNFASDREVGDRLMKIAPELPVMVRENKELLTRAVDWSARQGIRQFIDLGCGLPTEPSTHQTAQLVAPEAMTAYVDNDPVVISHLVARLTEDLMVTVIDNDVDDSGTVLAAAGELIDLSRPVCLLLGALVHFYKPDAARDLIARYVPALAPGSHVVLSAGYMPPGPDAERFVTVYSAGPHPLYVHSAEDLVSFLDGLEVLPPGVADARVWRPGCAAVPDPGRRAIWMNGVMAQVPTRKD